MLFGLGAVLQHSHTPSLRVTGFEDDDEDENENDHDYERPTRTKYEATNKTRVCAALLRIPISEVHHPTYGQNSASFT
jgi:hypothetical protein